MLNNNIALVQIMAWRAEQAPSHLPGPIMVWSTDAYASLGFDALVAFLVEVQTFEASKIKLLSWSFFIRPSLGEKYYGMAKGVCCSLRLLLLAWSSIAQSVCGRAFSLLASGCLRRSVSNPGLDRGRWLVSFRFEITSLYQFMLKAPKIWVIFLLSETP